MSFHESEATINGPLRISRMFHCLLSETTMKLDNGHVYPAEKVTLFPRIRAIV